MTNPSIDVLHTICVVGFGLIGALLSEGFAWLFVYRTEAYATLLDEVSRLSQRLELSKESAQKSVKTNTKTKAQESQLNKKQQGLALMRMKAGLFSSIFYFLIVPVFNSSFEGLVVARLPFEPMFLFKGLAHHGLASFTEPDCSSMYLYILSIGFFRTNLQKLINSSPSSINKNNQQAGGIASLFSSAK